MPDEYPASERLGPDLALDPTYQPQTYDEPMTGPGSWCVLENPATGLTLGTLWTSDAGGLGFIPATPAGIQRTPEFYMAFSRAAALGRPAAVVFAEYAGRAGQGLSAGPVQTGDLDTLKG